MKPYWAIFLLSLFLAYGSDLAPYYLAAISGGKIVVLGPLIKFEEPCYTDDRGEFRCATQYRIPNNLVPEGSEALGLGIIIQPIEIVCSEGRILKSLERDHLSRARIAGYLNIYNTVTLDERGCESDIIVRNWIRKSTVRYGYTQGPAIVGDLDWIARTKKLVEIFQASISILISLVFFIFFLAARVLQRAIGDGKPISIFDQFLPYWLVVINLGFILELFWPLNLPFSIDQRIANTCGLVFVYGATLAYFFSTPFGLKTIGRWFKPTEKNAYNDLSLKISLPIALGIGVSPYFSVAYPGMILLGGICGIVLGIRSVNLMFVLFGFAVFIDALKISMVPYLPASRLSIFYIALVFVHNLFHKIVKLQDEVRSDATLRLSLQIAHDIRAPVGTLKAVLPLLSGDESLRNMGIEALDRIKDIADDTLLSSRDVFATNEVIIALNEAESVILQVAGELRGLHQNIEFRYDPEKKPGRFCIQMEKSCFFRIVTNLLKNAAEAIGERSGVVHLTSTTVGKEFTLIIEDDGVGFPSEIFSLIEAKQYSPGRTTKLGGTGIGLYYVMEKLGEANGTILIASARHGGSRVTIRIPCLRYSDSLRRRHER